MEDGEMHDIIMLLMEKEYEELMHDVGEHKGMKRKRNL